jgi:Family of unknown function (DUF5335)
MAGVARDLWPLSGGAAGDRQSATPGVSADRVNHDGAIAISVARSAVDHFTHIVHDVSRIFIEQTHDGTTAALLIESTDATRTVLQLRAMGKLPAGT